MLSNELANLDINAIRGMAAKLRLLSKQVGFRRMNTLRECSEWHELVRCSVESTWGTYFEASMLALARRHSLAALDGKVLAYRRVLELCKGVNFFLIVTLLQRGPFFQEGLV